MVYQLSGHKMPAVRNDGRRVREKDDSPPDGKWLATGGSWGPNRTQIFLHLSSNDEFHRRTSSFRNVLLALDHCASMPQGREEVMQLGFQILPFSP